MSLTYEHRSAGFTVLELLVSLVLLSLLMALVSPALRLAGRGPAIASELERRSAIEAAMAFTTQRLAEATPIYLRGDDGRLQIQFEGKPDQIGFIAPVRFDAADNGLARFELAIGTDPDGQQGLMLSWKPWRPVSRNTAEATSGETATGGHTRVLVPGATALELRYFGSVRSRDEADWTANWMRTDALPKLVELAVTTPSGARQRVVILQLNLP